MTNQFDINYIDSGNTPHCILLHKPYPSDIDGDLNFNMSNFSFRSGDYDSYIDDINDESITLRGFENIDAMSKFVELGIIADEGYEITIENLNDTYDGTYIISNISYNPIGLDVFEYNLTLKFVRDITIPNYIKGPVHGEGSYCFMNGVIATNGKAIFAPYSSPHIGIYDPITNIYTSGPTHTSHGFFSCISLINGKVLLIGSDTNICLYDPITNIFSVGPAHGKGFDAFRTGVQVNSNSVILIPTKSANIGEYNPTTNTYSNKVVHGEGTYAFHGGVLLTNGNIIFAPHDSLHIGIYNPTTNIYTSGPIHGEGSSAFRGCILTKTGKVILIPYGSYYIGIYDPVANTYTRGPSTGVDWYQSGILLSNGRIILIPSWSEYISIYDPCTNAYYRSVEHKEIIGSCEFFDGGILLNDGRVLFVPYCCLNIGFYSP